MKRSHAARRCYPRFGEAGRSSTQSRSCGTRIDTTSVLQVFPVEILLVDPVDRIPDPGAHADPGYQKITVYLRKQLHRNVKIACLKANPPLDISDVVEQQLADWLKTQSIDS